MGSVYLTLKSHAASPDLTANSFVRDTCKRYPGSTPSPLDPETAKKKILLFYSSGRKGRTGAGRAVTDSSAETGGSVS